MYGLLRKGDGPMMPASVRLAVGGALALLVAGAIYLMIVRGPVLLIDLSASVAGLLCI